MELINFEARRKRHAIPRQRARYDQARGVSCKIVSSGGLSRRGGTAAAATRLHRSRSSRGGAWRVRGVGFSTSPEVVSKTANEVPCKRVVSFIVPAHNEEKYLAGTLCAIH